MTLDELGPRICILGPSNSGKSTLAVAIARARGLTAVHLDQLHHRPGTDWEPRPDSEFIPLHDAAIAGERWVMDGNYSRCLPQRLARATGLILLEAGVLTSLTRYLRRTWFERERHGALEGGRDSVKWGMLHYIAVQGTRHRQRFGAVFDGADLPKVRLKVGREVDGFYRAEGLARSII